MTGLYPSLGYKATDRNTVWRVAGSRNRPHRPDERVGGTLKADMTAARGRQTYHPARRASHPASAPAMKSQEAEAKASNVVS